MGAVAALAISVAGCSNPPERGVVTDANYTPAWIQVIPGTPPICSGNPPICTPGTPMQIIPWPDRWAIEITDSRGESGWRELSEDEYNRCNLAEVYPECTDPMIGDARHANS